MNNIKISVLIICYKQEILIKRAIESLLRQKEYIYEICVSDDCSPDKTWEVLQEYDSQYPGLFKLHQNRPNVGIFKNIEYTWTMPSGNIIYQLAGDDEVPDGWFKRIIDFVVEKKIDLQSRFCIYGDYKNIYPNGDSFTISQKCAEDNTNTLRYAWRGMLCNRSTCYSKSVLDRFINIGQGRSHIVEDAQDRQLQFFSEQNYYIPYVGNIYYSYIGVCTTITEEQLQERRDIKKFTIDFLKGQGYVFSNKDVAYADYSAEREVFLTTHSLTAFMRMIVLYVQSVDFSLTGDLSSFKRLCFAIRRRIPHKKPIEL